MAYTKPVKFTSTNNYGCGPADEDDVYTVEEFKAHCKARSFIDSDGYGYAVKDGMAEDDWDKTIHPSTAALIPTEATHIVWYNR